MLLLTTTTDKLQVITSSAATVDVHASIMDYNGVGVTPVRQNTAISSAVTTDVVDPPAVSVQRNVKTLHIRNKSTTLACDVTVQFNQNATLFELYKVTLQTGDALQYVEGVGFFVLASTKLNLKLRVTGDIIFNAAATLADITGLTAALKSGKKYNFEAHIFHISAATTTGAQFGVNYGATVTKVVAANNSGVTNSVTAGVISLGAVTALNTVITAQTTGSGALTLTILSGYINPSADGTFAVRATAEVAANMTVNEGSWLWIWESDN